jgi:hypothetical protein
MKNKKKNNLKAEGFATIFTRKHIYYYYAFFWMLLILYLFIK